MTHIRGDINRVLEIGKIAYTEQDTAFQNGWIYYIDPPHVAPPGTSGIVFNSVPYDTTQLLKSIQVSVDDLTSFHTVEISRASEGTVLFNSIFFQKGQWELNDAIIQSGDYIDLRWTNNAVGNVTFVITMLSVDAVGLLG